MIAPVRVLVNGRAARLCGGVEIPVDDLINDEVATFFRERLPELTGHLTIELNVTSNASPGAVITGGGETDREKWFTPKSLGDLRERRQLFANDTSLGTGWAPHNRVEAFVRSVADHFSGPDGFGR
jgi:S-adenosylmethionine synthetase